MEMWRHIMTLAGIWKQRPILELEGHHSLGSCYPDIAFEPLNVDASVATSGIATPQR